MINSRTRYGYIKVGGAIPQIKVAAPAYNAEQILLLLQLADQHQVSVLTFPELCLTGYTCGDLFDQRFLREEALSALNNLLEKTCDNQVLAVIGLPLEIQDSLCNCAVLMQKGNLVGVVPKMYLPNFGEYQEPRWFLSGLEISRSHQHIQLLGRRVPFGHLLFETSTYCLGVEICEDMWLPLSPGTVLALQGANLLVNPMAGNEGGSKAENRLKMVERQSSRCQSGYLLASAGVGESSTDLVYGGHIVIGENGALLENGQASRFQRKNSLITAEIDMENLQQIRLRNKSFAQQQGLTLHGETYVRIPISNRCDPPDILLPIQRFVRQKPFEPEEPQALAEHCQEILSIQTTALAKRLTSFNYSQIKLPISMDFNTLLAMIVAGETQRLLPQDRPEIIGFYSDSLSSEIMTYLKQFSKTLGISLVTDVLDQNNQAQLKILQLNSQNMSEAAIGQLHFTEKPQDIYCLNIGLPYTLVQQMVAWAEKQLYQGVAAKALQMLLKEARQTSLNLLTGQAPYQVLDFYLYYTLKFGTPPAKLLYLAEQAFAAEFTSAKLIKWLRLFYENFFTCQAQRSATPDGPKALDISLSPRVGLHWPSDASDMAWRAWFDTNA